MGLVSRELDRISEALRGPIDDEHYCQLYAAQQALCWVLDPNHFASPYVVVSGDKVRPIKGTPEG